MDPEALVSANADDAENRRRASRREEVILEVLEVATRQATEPNCGLEYLSPRVNTMRCCDSHKDKTVA